MYNIYIVYIILMIYWSRKIDYLVNFSFILIVIFIYFTVFCNFYKEIKY